jgi:hypothetical protein
MSRQEEELAKRIEAGAFARDVLAAYAVRTVRTVNESILPQCDEQKQFPPPQMPSADDSVRTHSEPMPGGRLGRSLAQSQW